MGAANLISYSLSPVLKKLRRWWIRRQLAHIRFHIEYIRMQRENDRHVERILMGREALLRSDLRNT